MEEEEKKVDRCNSISLGRVFFFWIIAFFVFFFMVGLVGHNFFYG